MKSFLVLIKKEWWEWKNMILWITGIYLFLMLLILVPITRISNDLNFDDLEAGMSEIEIDWGDEIKNHSQLSQLPLNTIGSSGVGVPIKVAYGIGLIIGIHFIQGLLLFIALFYFADSIFGERMDSSTLFIRSQPLNDHSVLLSKIVSGFSGIILTSLMLSVIFLLYIKLVVWIFGFHQLELYEELKNGVQVFDLYVDMGVYQFVTLLWYSPFLLFLMWVSASVKKKPLIVGLGSPILLAIVLIIVFNNSTMIEQLFGVLGDIKGIALEQLLIHENMTETVGKLEIFDSFFKYIFSLRSFVSVLIAGVFYFLALHSYRRNIPTS